MGEDQCWHINVDIKLDDTRCVPKYQTIGSACADLVARIPANMIDGVNMGTTLRLNYRSLAIIDCGLSMAVPSGFKLCVAARSGWAAKGLAVMNGVGQIDSDYRGNIKVIVANVVGKEIIVINDGDRIAQCWLEPVFKADWNIVTELPPTARADGGLGSTGI